MYVRHGIFFLCMLCIFTFLIFIAQTLFLFMSFSEQYRQSFKLKVCDILIIMCLVMFSLCLIKQNRDILLIVYNRLRAKA